MTLINYCHIVIHFSSKVDNQTKLSQIRKELSFDDWFSHVIITKGSIKKSCYCAKLFKYLSVNGKLFKIGLKH